MSKKKLKTLSDLGVFVYNDHKLPTNRREFLSSGLIGLSTMCLAPSLLFSSSNASAAIECNNAGDCGIPFLSFEGAGGMSIAGGNVMVGFSEDQSQENFGDGASMSDYIRLGLPPSMHPSNAGMLNKDYHLVFHSTSGLLAGLNEVLAPLPGEPDYRKSVDGIILCARTGDDSGNNPINAAFQAQRVGAKGRLVQLIGNSNTDTGSRSPAPSTQVNSALRASRITNFSEGSGLLNLGADLMNNSFLAAGNAGGTSRVKGFLNHILSLSKNRVDTFVNQEQEAQAMLTAQKGSKKLFDKFSPATLNPVNNAAALAKLQEAFGGTNMDVDDERIASVANLVTDRIAGCGAFTIGGCDYHNGSASSGQNKDKQIGRYIGKCIKLAALKGQNLFMHLYTDGAVGGANGGTTDDSPDGGGRVIWTNDSGTRSSQLCLVYKHDHDPATSGSLIMKDNKGNDKTRQIGYFNKAGGVNFGSSSIANSVDQTWKAVILNYMACMSTANGDAAVVADVLAKWRVAFPSETLPSDAEEMIRFKSLLV